MTEVRVSRNGVPIRLPTERWAHMIHEHQELADKHDVVWQAITEPDRIIAGASGALMAVRMVDQHKAMVVVYRETSIDDGFVITAFLTSRLAALDRRQQIWPPLN